ncbi:MAG: SNF2-related protein [Nitrosopumilus sp.]|nr:SNF2-related protein [Nitrosopumilus sp.]
MNEYDKFVTSKLVAFELAGFDVDESALNNGLFPFQKAIVKWALKKGKAAIFADTGLGKTIMQLEWAKHVYIKTNKPVLIIAPLCVAHQTIHEGEKFGIDGINYCRAQSQVIDGINITNYEMIGKFDLSIFSGVVLDESSIIKHQEGKIRKALIDACIETPYKLSCTATPSPNDHMELGNQAEFLGLMTMTEMLAMYFTHDGGDTNKWRLKGHGRIKFWEWLASWAVCIKKPSDIGFDDEGYSLPDMIIHEHIVESKPAEGFLFPIMEPGLQGRNKAKRESLHDRVNKCADIVNNSSESFLVWCHLNTESDLLDKQISDAQAVKGADKIEWKETTIDNFTDGKLRVLITKPSIAGFGMNWQHCNNMVFVGLSDSWEQFYQAIRRCWRFGQNKPVHVHVIGSEAEGAIAHNLKRKELQMDEMSRQMIQQMRGYMEREISNTSRGVTQYKPEKTLNIPEFLCSK